MTGFDQPAVKVFEHGDKNNRVKIKHRCASAAKTFSGIVSRQGKDVFHAHVCELQCSALHAHPVCISAGKMDNDIHPGINDFPAKSIRTQRRVSPGVVGYGNGCYASIFISIFGNTLNGVNSATA